MMIKKPCHKNEMLRPEEAALTGRNPEVVGWAVYGRRRGRRRSFTKHPKCHMLEYVVVR